MEKICYNPIGIIYTPYKKTEGVPIQATAAKGVSGRIEVFPEYADGLKDIQGFSHIILIYHFHMSGEPRLRIKPFLDNRLHGVFSTRAPLRPNKIGISTVRLLNVEENILYIQDIDILNKTPLLDIKPYVPEFDVRYPVKTGWLEKNIHKLQTTVADKRFIK